jgi:2-keto-3-deoxy-L-rhamnonate aldolase RhmA
MLPQVNDAETARNLVEWCCYPPAGTRGVALSARGAGYGRSRHGDVGALDHGVIRIAQIETRAAVEAVDEIAAVDGIDILFVGPTDLSHSLGVPGQFSHETFEAALRTIAEVGTARGRVLGAYLPSMAELNRYRDLGFTFLSIASDSGSLTAAFGTARSAAAAE